MNDELDAMVAEHVMGISLTPPREYAMAKVGMSLVRMTGTPFVLDDGREIHTPPGDHLRQPEGSADWNDRYGLYIAERLGDELTAAVDAYRLPAEPYSTDIGAAWRVVERMTEGRGWFEACLLPAYGERPGYRVNFTGNQKDFSHAQTMPEAIALAALKALGVEAPR